MMMSDNNLIFFFSFILLTLDVNGMLTCNYSLWIVYDRVIYTPTIDFNMLQSLDTLHVIV